MDHVGRVLPWGLLAAWVINDVEEWFTTAPWSARNARRIQELPIRVPWPSEGIPARQARTAISIVGLGIAAATSRGLLTHGHSPYYRASLLAFGLHGFTHLAQSLALRQYTPGVITGVSVVIPFWIWAEVERYRANSQPYTPAEIAGALTILASLPAVVATAGKITTTRHTHNPTTSGKHLHTALHQIWHHETWVRYTASLIRRRSGVALGTVAGNSEA